MGGELRSFEAVGYGICGLTDAWYTNTSGVAISMLTFLRDVLGNAATLIGLSSDPNEVIDSGVLYTPLTYWGKQPSTIIDALAKHGMGSATVVDNAPYDWQVYEGRIATFPPRVAPLRVEQCPPGTFGPTYHIDFDKDDIDWDPDYSDIASAVLVKYANGTPPVATSVTSSNRAVFDTYGIIRSVPLEGGTLSDPQAAQLALTYLALHSQPLVSVTIRRHGGKGLRRADGSETPPQNVRAGEWVQVGDQEPVILLSTAYNWTSMEWTATGGWHPAGYWQQLGQFERLLTAFQDNVNPASGAPN